MLFKCYRCSQSLGWQFTRSALCASCSKISWIYSHPDLIRHPWPQRPYILSLLSVFRLLEPSYSILKTWKKTGSKKIKQLLFCEISKVIHTLHTKNDNIQPYSNIAAILAIPQEHRRSLYLSGSPAFECARHLSDLIQKPVLDPWRYRRSFSNDSKSITQGALPFKQRKMILSQRLPFELNLHQTQVAQLKNKKILLVDDLMTSGNTIKAYSQLLYQDYGIRSHVFTLAVRSKLPEERLYDYRRIQQELNLTQRLQ
jgi:predicted amidophosphoribosyltransferase